MEFYYKACNDVLQMIDIYYESIEHRFKNEPGKKFTYYDKNPKTDWMNDYDGVLYNPIIIYNGNEITNDVDDSYYDNLRKYSLIDLRKIMYLCLIHINPGLQTNYEKLVGEIKAPYEAIKGVIKMIDNDIKTIGYDNLNNHLELVDRFNKLQSDYDVLNEKFTSIVKVINKS